jgi:imidazolonepropionase-like amidohydrolase
MGDDETTIERITALAECAYCPWKARLYGFDAIDVALSLRKILIDHVTYEHPEHSDKPVAFVGTKR